MRRCFPMVKMVMMMMMMLMILMMINIGPGRSENMDCDNNDGSMV
jgi:hypothetical protein